MILASILAASGRAADTGTITTLHLGLIVVCAVAAVAIICWGTYQKRLRRNAEQDGEARQAEMDAAGPPPPPVGEAPATAAIPLTRLKGLGPKAAALLAERGVGDVARLAALSDTAAAALDADLGEFSGRLSRDRWVEQARLLAAGDTDAYEKAFGKLG